MNEAEIKKLRKELAEIYTEYLKNPKDAGMKKKAKAVHEEFLEHAGLLDTAMAKGIIMLLDIAYDAPDASPPSKKVVDDLLKRLKAANQ